MRQPDFDLDRAFGAQAELWVNDFRKALQERAQVEVKAPRPFLEEGSFYAEYKCQGRNGRWYASGVSTSKAQLFFFKFGALPGGLVVETEWLKRAMKHAWKDPKKRKRCKRGENPTFAVAVSLEDLWATREGEP